MDDPRDMTLAERFDAVQFTHTHEVMASVVIAECDRCRAEIAAQSYIALLTERLKGAEAKLASVERVAYALEGALDEETGGGK